MYDFAEPNPISQRSDRLDTLRNQMQEWKRRTQIIENEIQDVLKHHRADTAGYIETSHLDQLYAEKFDVQRMLKYVKAQWESQEPRLYEALGHLDSVLDHLLSASMPPPNTRPAAQVHSIPTPVESRQCSYHSERQAMEPKQPGSEEQNTQEDDIGDVAASKDSPVGNTFESVPGNTGAVSLTPGRSIDFIEVSKKYPMLSFENPDDGRSRSFYILECKDCECVLNSVEGAVEHLLLEHAERGTPSKSDAVRELGTVVINCHEDQVAASNLLYRMEGKPRCSNVAARTPQQGADSGEDRAPPPQSGGQTAAASSTRKRKRESQPKGKSQSKSLPWRPPTTFSDLDPRVTCLQQGDVVAVWDGKKGKRQKFIPAMIIPWGDCIRFNVNDALSHWGLKNNIPNCYSRAESANAQSWATGYRDNEHLAHRREIPVLYFRKECDFPKDNRSGWIPLNKIKVYDPDCSNTIYKQAADDFISIWRQIYYTDLSPISKKYTTEHERMQERILLEEGRRQAREVDQQERLCQEERARADQESHIQEQIGGDEQESYDQEEGQGGGRVDDDDDTPEPANPHVWMGERFLNVISSIET